MAQYPIPQFIESEGKIISFLTYRQFFILVGGGAICFALYYFLKMPITFFIILSLPIALLTVAIAFFKVDNRSVVMLVLDFVLFLTKSKDYVWQKKDQPYPFKMKSTRLISNQGSNIPTPLQSKANNLNDAKKMVELRKK